METIRGNKLKDIFLDKNNWWRFYAEFAHLIRVDIVINVIKLLACGSTFLGFNLYKCLKCSTLKAVFHSCKARFCPSCGKKSTENWINKHMQILPNTRWQHVTFTFPKELQAIFWLNRHLHNQFFPLPARLITQKAMKVGVIPGVFIAMHTFGRDLKRNLHFHLSTTLSGLSLDKTKWMSSFRYNRKALADIKQRWTDEVISILRREYNASTLILPEDMTGEEFIAFLDGQKNRPPWVVHFAKPSDNHHRNVKYLGRYLKRPPIGETRIKDYDGDNVTFTYFDHHTKSEHDMTLPVFDFIKRLIAHVPDRYFRVVRYYNWLSTRTRNQYLPFVYKALKQKVSEVIGVLWRELRIKVFNQDPLLCPCCKSSVMTLVDTIYSHNITELKIRHQDVANPECHIAA